MEKKKRFKAGIILTAISLLAILSALAALLIFAGGSYEGWDALGAALLIALGLVAASAIALILSVISLILFIPAIKSSIKKIRIASAILTAFNSLLSVATLAFIISVYINGF